MAAPLQPSTTRMSETTSATEFDGTMWHYFRVLGVDEHKWKHVRGDGSSSFLAVLVDPTRWRMAPARHGYWAWFPGVRRSPHRSAGRP